MASCCHPGTAVPLLPSSCCHHLAADLMLPLWHDTASLTLVSCSYCTLAVVLTLRSLGWPPAAAGLHCHPDAAITLVPFPCCHPDAAFSTLWWPCCHPNAVIPKFPSWCCCHHTTILPLLASCCHSCPCHLQAGVEIPPSLNYCHQDDSLRLLSQLCHFHPAMLMMLLSHCPPHTEDTATNYSTWL